MGTTYNVVLSLSTTGSLDAKLENVGRKASVAHGHVSSLGEAASTLGEKIASAGESFAGALDGLVDKALHVGETLATIGIAAAAGLATYGVMHLNNELEQTQISLGAIAQAQGFAGTFEEGFAKAGDQLAKMKQDVKTLPGDLGQLSNIMKMIATPAAQGGASLDTIRKLAGSTMLTSTILGVQSDVAAREMANLLAGRAGAHNIFGSRLGLIGDEAQKFNKLSPAERLARLNVEIGKYSGAANRFGQSFIANFTTLKDNLKYGVLAEATAPLFEHVKQSLASINTWFDQHKDTVAAFTKMVGEGLANAWDAVTQRLAKIEPYIQRAIQAIAHLDARKVEHALASTALSVAAAKVAPHVISAGAEGLGGLVKMAPSLAGAAGPLAGIGESLAFLANPATAGAAAAALALFGTAAVAVVGAVHALTDETSAFHDYAVSLWHDISATVGDAFSRLKAAGEEMWQALSPLVDMMGTDLLFAIKQTVPVLEAVASGFTAAAHGLENMLGVLRSIPGVGQFVPGGGGSATAFTREEHLQGITGRGHLKEAAEKFGEAVTKKGGGGGGGGTNIQKVEIVVNSNQDPSRIARIVFDEMKKVGRNPKASSHVPNYSGPHG